MSFFKRSL